METVRDNQHVIVRRARDVRLLLVKSGKGGSIGKIRFDYGGLIGQKFGLTYEIRHKRLHPYSAADFHAMQHGADEEEELEPEEDNTEEVEKVDSVQISASQQAVGADEVEKMKQSGVSGREIITKLVDGHSSFRQKTTFAQEKYVAKKARKYSAVVTIEKPTVRSICEIYYAKDTEKISYLRPDCLAHLLTWSNAHYGYNVVVVEQCLGLVTAGVLERLAGRGACVRLHKGATLQSIPCLAAMDFDENILSTLLPLPFDDFSNEADRCDSAESANRTEENAKMQLDEEKFADDDDDGRCARREQREQSKAAALKLLRERNVDGLIVATKQHPLPFLKKLVPYVAPSRPFVVFCSYIQPLLECYKWLRDEGGKTVNVQLFDNFFRRYQVLPGRTHPEMNQFVAAGYILTGIVVAD